MLQTEWITPSYNIREDVSSFEVEASSVIEGTLTQFSSLEQILVILCCACLKINTTKGSWNMQRVGHYNASHLGAHIAYT